MCADVSRATRNRPLDGVAELVATSIIVIVFLQCQPRCATADGARPIFSSIRSSRAGRASAAFCVQCFR